MSDVFERIGGQLARAERDLWLAAHPPAGARDRRERRSRRRWVRRHFVLVAALVAASGTAGGIALANALGGSTPTDSQYLYRGQHALPETAMTAEQTANLAVLRRPRTAADAIPPGAKFISDPAAAMGIGEDGANLALSRLAQQTNGISAWVVPADDGLVCLIVAAAAANSPYQSGGPSCAPATAASTSAQHACDGPDCNDTYRPGETATDGDLQASTFAGRDSRLPGYWAGVVPDGVSAVTLHVYGGASETVPVHNNVYIAAVHPTGSSLPVYENLGESPPPASAPPTFWVTFESPTAPVTALIGGIAGQGRSTSSTTTTDRNGYQGACAARRAERLCDSLLAG